MQFLRPENICFPLSIWNFSESEQSSIERMLETYGSSTSFRVPVETPANMMDWKDGYRERAHFIKYYNGDPQYMLTWEENHTGRNAEIEQRIPNPPEHKCQIFEELEIILANVRYARTFPGRGLNSFAYLKYLSTSLTKGTIWQVIEHQQLYLQ